MQFYTRLFLGFYCLVKKILPKENKPETFAVAAMAGSTSLLYFALTYFIVKRAATMFETAGLFLILYAAHHYLFVYQDKFKKMESEVECSDRLIYRSVLFFIISLSLLMWVTSIMTR